MPDRRAWPGARTRIRRLRHRRPSTHIPRADALDRWLAAGLRRDHAVPAPPGGASGRMPGSDRPAGRARAVVVLDNYYPAPTRRPAPASRIAKYARGPDYHLVTWPSGCDRLAAWLRASGAGLAHAWVDAWPGARARAGRARRPRVDRQEHHADPSPGSARSLFIGSVLHRSADWRARAAGRDRPLRHLHPVPRRLPHAAPSSSRRVLDATRCISYLTIEHKAPIPGRAARRDSTAGPSAATSATTSAPGISAFARPTTIDDYRDRGTPAGAIPSSSSGSTEAEFAERFGDTPLERPGLERMRRNVRAAMASRAASSPSPGSES